jgi:hypothetical protein
MRRVRCTWNTGYGGPGLSTFYSLDSVDATVDLNTFWNAVKGVLSSTVNVAVPNSGDTLDAASGNLVGGWSGGTAGTYTGTSAGAYAAGTGAFIKWNTGSVVAGHRVVGRTYIAPILGAGYDTDGTIAGGYLTILQNAATALAGSGKIYVWHRPSGPGATDGQMVLITSATVPDKVTSLASRRH